MHLAMLFTATCWAANIVAVKEALRGFSPIALAQVRCIGAALVFGILFLIFRGWSSLRLSRRDLLYLAGMGFCGITLNQMLFIGGISKTSVPHAALIIAVEPVMVLILAVLMRLELLTFLKSAGAMISFSGVVVLTYEKSGHAGHAYWVGDLILLMQTVVFAYYTIMAKKAAHQYDAVTLNMMVFGLGAILMIPFGAGAVWHMHWSHIPAASFWALAFMVVFSSVIGYLLFAFALTGLTASRVAAFNYVEPVIATALGVWLLKDRIGLHAAIGGALILIGVYFAERERGGRETSGKTA